MASELGLTCEGPCTVLSVRHKSETTRATRIETTVRNVNHSMDVTDFCSPTFPRWLPIMQVCRRADCTASDVALPNPPAAHRQQRPPVTCATALFYLL